MTPAAVAFELRQASGTRPFVPALVDGVPVSLMVHSNASLGLMLTHDTAARVGLATGDVERPDYGIAAVGRLGGRGRASAAVGSLQVGDDVATDVRATVFELPTEPDEEPVEGMLGLGWLRGRGVVVDLARRLVVPGGGPIDGVVLRRRPDWDAWVIDTVVNGRAAQWVVSTVAGVLVDAPAAHRLGLALGDAAEDDGGPTGTVVTTRHVTGPWSVDVGGRSFAVHDAIASDLYAYAATPRTGKDETFAGYLGCDFLLEHRAVVDLGRGVLALAGA
ncbi:hypothetical protein GCM10023340_44220 [Nocardioides marinquilinus]|uniref:Uncharacterized protein n=1 Tax=Nocardioides marinquilinus TaxID=1210400 RepID=A0ABP9Q3T3_9ACTN